MCVREHYACKASLDSGRHHINGGRQLLFQAKTALVELLSEIDHVMLATMMTGTQRQGRGRAHVAIIIGEQFNTGEHFSNHRRCVVDLWPMGLRRKEREAEMATRPASSEPHACTVCHYCVSEPSDGSALANGTRKGARSRRVSACRGAGLLATVATEHGNSGQVARGPPHGLASLGVER